MANSRAQRTIEINANIKEKWTWLISLWPLAVLSNRARQLFQACLSVRLGRIWDGATRTAMTFTS